MLVHQFLFMFENVATRKLEGTYVTHIIFLLESTGLEGLAAGGLDGLMPLNHKTAI